MYIIMLCLSFLSGIVIGLTAENNKDFWRSIIIYCVAYTLGYVWHMVNM